MAKTFQATFFLHTFNTIIIALLRAGVNIGKMTLLTVRGRKSGLPRTTPVWLNEHQRQRWLILPTVRSTVVLQKFLSSSK